MLAIYASTVGNIGTGVFIGAGIGTIACVHFFARAQGNGWTSAYLHLWHGTALCVMDLSLLFILSQSLSRSRDSPSHIPTEFAYAPIVLSFIFVFPKVMEGSGPCQGQSLLLDRILFLLGACSFLFVCLYTPDMHGSSYPAGAWAIPLFCALVVLYAIPQDPSGGTQRAMDMVAAAKCMTLVIGILLFNRKDSGHNAIMYDYYSLR